MAPWHEQSDGLTEGSTLGLIKGLLRARVVSYPPFEGKLSFISRDVAVVADQPHKLRVVGSSPTPATSQLDGVDVKETVTFVRGHSGPS